MTLARRVPVNFEKVLRFLTEHSKANTFVPFKFFEILPVDLAQPYEYGIPEMLDPGSRTLRRDPKWDPTVEIWVGSLR